LSGTLLPGWLALAHDPFSAAFHRLNTGSDGAATRWLASTNTSAANAAGPVPAPGLRRVHEAPVVM